jgi:hypothetical protein
MITDTTVLDALQRASAAHGTYEEHELGGVYHEEWADWYAEHMSASLRGEGFVLTSDFLAHQLREAATAHGLREASPDDPDDAWPAWYVAHMMPAITQKVSEA